MLEVVFLCVFSYAACKNVLCVYVTLLHSLPDQSSSVVVLAFLLCNSSCLSGLPVRGMAENICPVCVVLNLHLQIPTMAIEETFKPNVHNQQDILSRSRIPEWPHGTDVCGFVRCWPETDVVPLRHTQAFWGRYSRSSPDDSPQIGCCLRSARIRFVPFEKHTPNDTTTCPSGAGGSVAFWRLFSSFVV